MSSALTWGAPAHNNMKKNQQKTPATQSKMGKLLHTGPRENGARPSQVNYGPRGVVGTPRGSIRGPRPYGYYRGGFPVWLTSYAVVMSTLEECPPSNEGLEFAQKSEGICLMVCDKVHCIQSMNYCCYYVEPEKYMVVAAKK